MSLINIDDRLFIEPVGFGDYSHPRVHQSLSAIAKDLKSLVRTDALNMDVHIMYANGFDHPECCSSPHYRIIYLYTRGNYWCQWIYQFSHEYLHHLIDGPMTGDIEGSKWFEETLCELSSMYYLYHLANIFILHSDLILRGYALWVRNYLDDLLVSNEDLKLELQSNGGVWQWLPLLCETQYHREYYNAIACHILPCFLENRNLWKMCSHIGDSRQYSDLKSLFGKLLPLADESYRDSLEKMCKLLLP